MSLINLMGLSVGMTAGVLIFLYVAFEKSYDEFHSKGHRIYRLVCDTQTADGVSKGFHTSAAMAANLKADFPEVEEVASVSRGNLLVRSGDVKFQEEHTLNVDSNFFSVFDFPLRQGNPRIALTRPISIVLSESAAKKYFGTDNPMSQHVLLSQNNWIGTVTGIMRDIPENSQIKADILFFSGKVPNAQSDTDWNDLSYVNYVLLKTGADGKDLEAKLPLFLERHIGQRQGLNQGKVSYRLSLEPLKDVYLHSTRGGFVSGNMNNVYIFSAIAVLILFIACINFVNLSTARSAERAREIGIRKLTGAAKGQLVGQFITESIVICLIAFLLSLLLSSLLLPEFNQLAGKTVSHNIFHPMASILYLLMLAIFVGVVAGIYAAVVLSSYKPVSVLKGSFVKSGHGMFLRRALVVAQFVISFILITGTIVIYAQLDYMRSQDLGFNKEQTMIIDTRTDPHGAVFKQAILNIPGVQSGAFSSGIAGALNDRKIKFRITNRSGEMQTEEFETNFIDFDFIKQYQIRMAAGRPFSTGFGDDSRHSLILNETAVNILGYSFPQDAVGMKFSLGGTEGKIIGVVKDFHSRSLQEPIQPLAMYIGQEGQGEYISIKVASDNLPNTLSAIERKWTTLIPYRPFNYFFADEYFDRQYRSENRFGKLFLNFAVLAIFISCLGLFGLALTNTLQRAKEISIRKVLGASISDIVGMLTGDFMKLVIVAIVIGSPVAWWAVDRWLDDFAYRIPVGWWIFAVAGCIAVLIALISTSFLALKTATANPLKNLRAD